MRVEGGEYEHRAVEILGRLPTGFGKRFSISLRLALKNADSSIFLPVQAVSVWKR